MKSLLKIAFLLLLLIVGFVIYTLATTGTFRSIENTEGIELLHSYALNGAEDITLSRKDSFAIISATDRSTFPPTRIERGDLHYLDLRDLQAGPMNLTSSFSSSFAPHGISMFPLDTSYIIAAISHVGDEHIVEMFELSGTTLSHKTSIKSPMLISPNDLVLTGQNKFYISNDHKYPKGFMRFMEDYGGLAASNVLYYDGTNFSEVADGIAYANGINYDSKKKLLYVSSPRGFEVKVYEENTPGKVTHIEDIDCSTGVDNIEFDEEMNLWIGAHPDLIHFAAYAKGDKDIAPSEIIKINYKAKGEAEIKQILLNDGSLMSGSSVAVPYGDKLLLGNVKDTKMVVTRMPK